jgi:predicted PurR-regulated permease PerM
MTREQLFGAFFFAAFLFLLYQFLIILSFFVGPLSWAALLAIIFFPAQQWLVRTTRRSEGLVAFLLTTLVILVVIVPTISLTTVLARESVDLYQELNDLAESGRLGEILERFHNSAAGRIWARLMPMLADWRIDPTDVALRASKAVSSFLAAQAPAAAANVLRYVASFFFTTFALFFFFRDGERMVRGLRDLIPMEPVHKDAILKRLYDTLSAVVQGALVTAAVQGVLAGIGFWIVGVRYAIVLGGATALLSLVPFAGPLIWVSVDLYLLATGHYGQALVLLAWGVLVVGMADNFVRPLIIGGRTQIPTVYLFFGILGGLQAYGFLGIFLGPVLIAILVAFVQIYRERYADAPARG